MNKFKKIIFVFVAVLVLFGATNNAQASTVVFSGSESQLMNQYGSLIQQDMIDNGGVYQGNAGIYAGGNARTLDRICELIDPTSTASYWKSDDYTSPGNNSIVLWNGSSWEKHGARNYNNHLRSNLTCTSYAPPAPVNYAAYCGDGIVNQAWEQCDGDNSCTDQCLDTTSNQCVDLILARVNITNISNDYFEFETGENGSGGGGVYTHPYYNLYKAIVKTAHAAVFGGDITSDIFVGNSLNRIPQGTWFPLYYNGSYYNDPSISGYENVPGIAVQRIEGRITTLVHGSHTNGGSEHVEGNIEIWNADITTQSNDTSGNNQFENPTDGNMAVNPFQDEYWKSGGKSYFWSTVTAQDDSFYTYYDDDSPMCLIDTDPTLVFTSNPSVINNGDSSVITWNSTNTSTCVGTNFDTNGNTSGSVTVSPSTDTTYEVVCSGQYGSTDDTETIFVTPNPTDPTANLDLNPNTNIEPGDGVQLTWTSTNATSCVGTNFTTGDATSGSITVYPFSDTTYLIECTGSGGTATDSDTAVVNNVDDPTVDFVGDPTTIDFGESTELTWNSDNTTICTSDDFDTDDDTDGSVTVSPSVTTTYEIECVGSSGTITDSVIIIVNTGGGGGDPAPVCTLEANPRNITTGVTTELIWTSTNATSGSIDNGVGSISSVDDGEVDVTPSSTVTYTATFTGPGGTTTCSEEVTVDSLPACTNCGGGGGPPFDPNISLAINDNPGEQPLALVYLSQIPYTGFGAGPIATTSFWIIILGISAFLGHIIVSRGVMQKLITLVGQHGATIYSDHKKQKNNMNFTDTTTDNKDEEVEDTPPTPTDLSGLSGTLEARAHEENILVSSEGLNIVIGLGGGTEHGAFEILETLLKRAKDTYPREDGWILLNTKRVHNLLPHTTVQNTPEVDETDEEVITEEDKVQAPTEDDNGSEKISDEKVVIEFIKNIILKDVNKTFEILRDIKDITPPEFIAQVVVTLDEVYKDRLEGYRNKNEEVSKLLSDWTDASLEGVIEILAESIDHTYKSNRIGVKVALTKMFKFLG